MLLRRALLRELSRGKWSLLAALVGLSVAVASVTAVHLLNARVALNLEQLQPLGLSAHIARREDGGAIAISDYAALVEKLARGGIPSVSALVPLIDGTLEDGWRILGMDWVAMRNARQTGPSLATGGEVEFGALLTRLSVLVPESSDLGDELRLAGRSVRILGKHSTGDERLLVSDIATASELLQQDAISALALVEAPATFSLVDILDHLFVGLGAVRRSSMRQDTLGAGYIISSPDQDLPVRRFVTAIMFNLGVLSVLCLLVAGFIAFQSAAGTAQRRAPLMGRLASMGAHPTRLRRLVYGESAAIGLIACAIGLPLGMATSNLAIQMRDLRAQLDFQLDPWLVAKAITLGIGVSLLGTLLAQARSQAREKDQHFAWLWFLPGPVLVVLGLFGGLPGVFLTLGGLFLVFVQVAWLMLRRISRMPLLQMPMRGREVLRGASTHAMKLFPVVSAFILALAVALAMQLMVSSLKNDFDLFLDQRLDGELNVEGGAGGLSREQIHDLASIPGVTNTRDAQTAMAWVGPLRVEVRLIDYSPAGLMRYGALPDTPENSILINGQLAAEQEEAAMLHITSDQGQANLPVADEFNDFGALGPRMGMSKQLGAELFAHTRVESLRLFVESGMEDQVRLRIEEELGLAVRSTAESRHGAERALNDTFWISDVLSLVALLVAVFGIITGFNQLHLTRLREFRLLRGLGVSSRELLALVAAQSGVMAALALPFALTLALIMAWILCQQVNPLAFGFSINLGLDWRLILVFAGIGICVAPLASLLPWRMTREVSHVATTDESL